MPMFTEDEREREKVRVRDLLRYYTPDEYRFTRQNEEDEAFSRHAKQTDTKHGGAGCEQDSGALSLCLPAEPPTDSPDPDKLLKHDPTLTAFAQLGALRLNTERSFISLMDTDNQYIIAEATRSVSLHNRDRTDPGDGIFLGARILDMVWGVCPNTIQVFTAADDSKNVSSSLVTANKDCYVMNDLSAIKHFEAKTYILGWPYMKFYAEVPIHSPTGCVIGTFCVVDNKPRDGLDAKGLEILNEIASAIMNHLELVHQTMALESEERMVKGLGLFVKGKDVLKENFAQESTDDSDRSTQISSYPTLNGNTPILPSLGDHPENVQTPPGYPSPTKNEKVTQGSKGTDSSFPFPKMAKTPENRPLTSRTSSSESARQESIASERIKGLFSRASYLLRESMDIDGVIFVDACFRDSSKGTSKRSSHVNAERSWARDASVAGPSSTFIEDMMNNQNSGLKRSSKLLTSDLLGCSIKKEEGSDIKTLPQGTVRGLMTCYNQGRIFLYDENGSLDSSAKPFETYEDNPKNLVPGKDTVAAWAKQLIQVCQGARMIIFFPLWDPQRDKYQQDFGQSWGISHIQSSQLIQGAVNARDLTYVAAFGNCIMTEKSRLDAELADRAKSDFISVVSHELRSPLHGVLANAEALKDTSTDEEQNDMIRSISICGEVLLDTMDHILDYAKISNKEDSKEVPMQFSGEETDFDLCILAEDVIEGVSAGQSFRSTFEAPMSSPRNDGENFEVTDLNGHLDNDSNVVVILTIDWQASWLFKSQVSSWRRILINLFQNAIKYTKTGYVHVCLSARKTHGNTIATLSIVDSGKGISKDYLKYELYTPFVQEDPMSIGTGLGLSIVNQLVQNLEGRIDIVSEVGAGTSVRVEIPINPTLAITGLDTITGHTLVVETRKKCSGMSMCLLGLENFPDLFDIPTQFRSVYEGRMVAIKSSLMTYAGDWFGMAIRKACSMPSTNDCVFVCTKSQMDTTHAIDHKPLIVFDDEVTAGLSRNDKGIFYLTQPVGPHKLARALTQCVDYSKSLQLAIASTTVVETVTEPIITHKEEPISEPIRPATIAKAQTAVKQVTNQINRIKAVEFLARDLEEQKRPRIEVRQISSTSSTDTLVSPEATEQASIQFPASVDSPKPTSSPVKEVEKMEEIPENSKPKSDKQMTSMEIPEQVPQEAAEIQVAKATTKSQRNVVLLVEDNIINLKFLVHGMKKAKEEYTTASNGLEALNKYREAYEKIKIILMDISMPVMDGLTATRHIREFEEQASLPQVRIVALTCFGTEEHRRDAQLSGVNIFLTKPIKMGKLKPILELDPDSRREGEGEGEMLVGG